MKKINSILMILAAAAGITNCTKAELVKNQEAGNGGTVVYATTDAATKTTLDNDYKVLWSTGDKIKFVKDDATGSTYTFTLDTGSGSSSGTFKCTETPSDGTYTVYYPVAYDGTNWPAQTYVSVDDISGAPMTATATVSGGSVSDITFTNEGGILRYTVEGSKTIKSINVKSGSTLDVTLDCGEGVALASNGTVFNIALPDDTYSNATLKFTATDNTVATKTASSFKVTKNMVSLATFDASDLLFELEYVVMKMSTGDDAYTRKWATMNLGATTVAGSYTTCYGDLYQWGSVETLYTGFPWTSAKAGNFTDKWKSGKGSGFVDSNNPHYGTSAYIKYTDSDEMTVLEAADDVVATKYPGTSWRMPTSQDFNDLADACGGKDNYDNATYNGVTCGESTTFSKGIYWCTSYDGVAGCLFYDGTNRLFFPAAGLGNQTALNNAGSRCYYWSSTRGSSDTLANFVSFYSGSVGLQNNIARYGGLSVRPVSN